MELIPSIDLLGGNVVRLHQGDYGAATVYARDIHELVMGFVSAGARRLHVVDLDGARDGSPSHIAMIRSIVEDADGLRVQVGGGVRDRASAVAWLEAGVDRVVLGTLAVRKPHEVEALCRDYAGRVVVAIDARGDEVSVEGWLTGSGVSVLELAERADGWGASAILYTDIARDGTGEGPAVERTARLQGHLRADVIASGGVGSLEHIRQLREAGVRAAVCGRALYEGQVMLSEGLQVASGEG